MLLFLLLGLYSIKVLVEVVKLAFLISELVFQHYIFILAVTVFTLQFPEGFFQVILFFFVCCKCQPESALLDLFLEHHYYISESTGLEGSSCELF